MHTAESIYATTSIKPARIAYVVERGDKQALLQAVQCSSSLWGGMLNPIITVRGEGNDDDLLRKFADRFEPSQLVIADNIRNPFSSIYRNPEFSCGLEEH